MEPLKIDYDTHDRAIRPKPYIPYDPKKPTEKKPCQAKYKILTARSLSIAILCEPEAYVKMACDKGISQEGFIEFLDVAMTMQGCPGEVWALKAYGYYKSYASGDLDGAGCCSH